MRMSLILLSRRLFPLFLAVLLIRPDVVAAQGPDIARARRLIDIATIALAEYAEGVIDGDVVRVEELNEARLFLEQARPAAVEFGVEDIVNEMARGVNALSPHAELESLLSRLRRELESALGVALDPLPSAAPSLARGAAVYRQACAACHGETGAGGPLASTLDPPPGDLTDRAALAGVTVTEFFRKINVGVAGTAMPAFADQLAMDDRWAVALYAASLRWPSPSKQAIELMASGCPGCLLSLSDFGTTAGLSDDTLRAVVVERLALRPDDTLLPELVGYARAAGAREHLGADVELEAARVVARSGALVESALAAATAGDRELADQRAVDAYLAFERVETRVRARDARAAARVEAAFAELRGALAGGSASEWETKQAEVSAALEGALDRLTTQASPWVLFSQSLIIMLREGLEAILIIGALVAFLTRAGAGAQKREIGWGVLAALGASAITAVGFATLFGSAVVEQEILEGVTMLVGSAVLFWVSYWLVSKIEVRKWQQFVRAQMQRALRSKRTWALAAVAFLAVYREGFETVLFYAALFSSADGAVGGSSAIVVGILIGSALLGVIYYLMQRFGVRLPLKPFFAVTSTLLYVMAFSFAGQGVAELQEAGVISLTPLSWIPSLPALGIFPTLQTAVSQLVLCVALGVALVWIFWLEPKTVRARA